ncbi:hypothetical protein GCM10011414_22390 [Croceivirga lutea]|uniref:hypothetical protein n=1 Tax=Croceivirga lutea TaxID=1775167 RepID=UPI00163A3D59|nr:hypothetical protein [Croceivirga lutea]GGG52337.1 hypothetical protein GCM10011414_22390 [Croceivirga lutea]
MKYLFSFAIALAVMQISFSQDLIVTTSNDSILCKITKVKKNNIVFIYKKGQKYTSTLIETNKVKAYQYNFNRAQAIPKDSLPGYEKYPRHLFALSGGLSYEPGKNDGFFPPELSAYEKQLRWGSHLDFNYSYYFLENYGVGITVNYYKSTAEQGGIIFTDEFGNSTNEVVSSTITTLFIGPSISMRYLNKTQRNVFVWNTALGYISYKDISSFNSESTSTANGFGVSFNLGYNFGINDNLSLGIQAGITSALLKKVTIEDNTGSFTYELPDNTRLIGSGHLDFGIGLRYAFD